MAIKLYYFDLPARAEATRLILTYGGIDFEDIRVKKEEWMAFKPKTPFGQMPVMVTTNGTWLAQGHVLERYAGALAGLIPSDPLTAAIADQAIFQMDDIAQLFAATSKLTGEEQLAARQDLLKGAVGTKLQQLCKLLDGKTYFAGDKVSYVDFVLFAGLSNLKSGFISGVPATYLDDHPALKEFHTRVASLDKVKAYYAGRTGLYAAFSA